VILDAVRAWDPGDGVTLRSAMHERFRAAGATFARRGAWLVPAAVPGEPERLTRVGFADASHLGKVELRGGEAPAGGPDRAVVAAGPGRWLVLCHPGARAGVVAEADGRALAADLTGAWSLLVLAGPEAGRLLRRLGPVAEVPGAGPLAGVPARVLERAGALWVLVAAEYAQHGFDAVADACAPLGGGPAGLDAVLALTGDPLLAPEPAGALR
jgi:glycine cleavage system aminomethyltransferase T